MISRSTDVKVALRSRQRGLLLNPFRFAPAGAWRTAFDRGAGLSNGSFNGFTTRDVVSTTLLAGSATKMKVTFKSATSAGCTITKAFMQIAASSGDPYDFASTPVQITFAGANNYTIPTNSTVTSDEINLAIDGTRNLVISVYMGSLSFVRAWSGLSGLTVRYKSGDQAATVDATSDYTTTTQGPVNKLELFG